MHVHTPGSCIGATPETLDLGGEEAGMGPDFQSDFRSALEVLRPVLREPVSLKFCI